MWRRAHGFVAAALVLLGVAVAPAKVALAAGAQCQQARILYAVRANTGHLVEIDYCDGPGFLQEREVSADDWRQYLQIVPGGQGVVYALTADGTLLWRKQSGPAEPLSAPVAVGSSVSWLHYQLVSAGNGYLVGVSDRTEVFLHRDWATGGPVVSEEPPSSLTVNQYPLTYVHGGSFAESVDRGWHLRVWFTNGRARLYSSGAFPPDVTSVTGGDPALFGIDRDGSVVRLSQTIRYVRNASGNLVTCPIAEPAAWQVAGKFSGGNQAVFGSPDAGPLWPPVLGNKPMQDPACGVDPNPVEWQ